MSCVSNYYKTFECDSRTTELVNRILQEYKPLLRWIRNRPNKYGEDFKQDLYQMTLYCLIVNTNNRVHNHDYTDEEIIRWGAQSIYKAYQDAYKNLPANMKNLDMYASSIDEDTDESGRMPAGHVLAPTSIDDNLERSGEPTLEELIESLPCDDSLKTAILMMTHGFKQNEAAEALNIPRNTLSMRLKALRESDKFRKWAKLNGMNIGSLKL